MNTKKEKRSSEILADEKTYFLGKVTWKSVTCEIFHDSLQNFPEIEEECFELSLGDGRPCLH